MSNTKRKSAKRTPRQKPVSVLLTAERIRAVLESNKVNEQVKERLAELIQDLHEHCNNSMIETEPALLTIFFEWGAAGLHVMRRSDPTGYKQHSPLYDEIVRLAAEYEPEEYKVARRCVEIYHEWLRRKAGRKYADGADFFAKYIDNVMRYGEGVLLDFDSDYFVPFFVKAAQDAAPRNFDYRELLKLIKRVDEGADLNALHDEQEARGRKA